MMMTKIEKQKMAELQPGEIASVCGQHYLLRHYLLRPVACPAYTYTIGRVSVSPPFPNRCPLTDSIAT